MRSPNAQHLAVSQRLRSPSTCEPQPRKLRETLRSATVTSSGMPLRSISSTAKRSSASASSSKLASRSVAAPERRHLGAGVLDDDLDQAEVVDVLVGDDDQLEVVDRVAALRPAATVSSSSALPELGPVSTRVSGSSSIR